MTLLATLTGKLIAGLVVLALLFGLYAWATWDNAEQPKQEARSAKASADTAKQTAQTVIDRAESDASVDQLVAETARQIDTLPLPEAAKVARKAICSLSEYEGDPSCAK